MSLNSPRYSNSMRILLCGPRGESPFNLSLNRCRMLIRWVVLALQKKISTLILNERKLHDLERKFHRSCGLAAKHLGQIEAVIGHKSGDQGDLLVGKPEMKIS
jgi:hypothetical protein